MVQRVRSCEARGPKIEIKMMSSAKKTPSRVGNSGGKRRRRLRSHENRRKVVRKMVKGPLQLNLSLVSQEQPQQNHNLGFPQDKGVLNVVEVGTGNISMRSTRYQNKPKPNGAQTDRAPAGHSEFTFHGVSHFRSVSHQKKEPPHNLFKKDKENLNSKNVNYIF